MDISLDEVYADFGDDGPTQVAVENTNGNVVAVNKKFIVVRKYYEFKKYPLPVDKVDSIGLYGDKILLGNKDKDSVITSLDGTILKQVPRIKTVSTYLDKIVSVVDEKKIALFSFDPKEKHERIFETKQKISNVELTKNVMVFYYYSGEVIFNFMNTESSIKDIKIEKTYSFKPYTGFPNSLMFSLDYSRLATYQTANNEPIKIWSFNYPKFDIQLMREIKVTGEVEKMILKDNLLAYSTVHKGTRNGFVSSISTGEFIDQFASRITNFDFDGETIAALTTEQEKGESIKYLLVVLTLSEESEDEEEEEEEPVKKNNNKRKKTVIDPNLFALSKHLKQYPRNRIEKVYSKRLDKVYKLGDDEFIKFSHEGEVEDMKTEINKLRKLQNAKPESEFLMKLTFNEEVRVGKENYHVVASTNAGTAMKYSKNKKIPGFELSIIFHDLFSALLHLHDVVGLVHLDIHPSNYVRNPSTGKWTLIDLDLAQPSTIKMNTDHFYPFHTGFKDEHHPAVALLKDWGSSVEFTRRKAVQTMLKVKYDKSEWKYLFRIIDFIQLMMAINSTTNIFANEGPPPYLNISENYYFTDVDINDAPNRVYNFLADTITDTEKAFRLNNKNDNKDTLPSYKSMKEVIKAYIELIKKTDGLEGTPSDGWEVYNTTSKTFSQNKKSLKPVFDVEDEYYESTSPANKRPRIIQKSSGQIIFLS